MQTLIEFIAGLVALLAAAMLAQVGVELKRPQSESQEVHRVSDCHTPAAPASAETPQPTRTTTC